MPFSISVSRSPGLRLRQVSTWRRVTVLRRSRTASTVSEQDMRLGIGGFLA